MKPFLIFAYLFLCLPNIEAQTSAGSILDDPIKQKVDSLFTEFDSDDSPGYAIGISKNGKTIYKEGYGSANLDYNIPISAESSFSIASVSKQFTAACVALLILDGEISLETPAATFIPELKKYNATILIKHLIYNTSGITDYYRLDRLGGKSWHTFNYFEIDECISISLAQDTLAFVPGTRWDYCNVNFMLLTKIVEEVSGMTFAEFAKSRLFEPLEMNGTLINVDATTVIKNRVTPYNIRNKESVSAYSENGVSITSHGKYIQHPRVSPHFGGSGVVTTIDDLLKWSANMFSRDFGGEAFYELMHKTPKFEHDRSNQAFGLYVGDFNGHKIVAWDGGDWGISAQMLRFTEQGVAIIVLSNLGSGESFRKVNGIADILFEEGILK